MTPRVLLLGGHGKISQLLTPLILSRSWQLTSVIRDVAQKPTITALARDQPGKLDILVSSLEEVKSQAQAQSIIDSTSPDYIVFSAGAGGKGGPERTLAIDRDACIAFIRASVATPSVTRFLVVSYVGSNRSKSPWWSEEEWKDAQEINNSVLKRYYPAKLAADECLTALAAKRGAGFAGISLRPGRLTDEEGEGKVALGKTAARGSVRRRDVARVAMALLESEEIKSCWLDLLQGEESVEAAVKRCIGERVDCSEGQDLDRMTKEWT